MTKRLYLSHLLDSQTPTYGNRNQFVCERRSAIAKGDVANDSHIETTVHIGTHIDMPYHFFEEGQTIEDFDSDFFAFNRVHFLSFTPQERVIHQELIDQLEPIEEKASIELLIIKTGICHQRTTPYFWEENYGFAPEVAHYLRTHFPKVRVIGFDSISVSSFAHRMVGREAHRAFLDPSHPILLIEDMDLCLLQASSQIKHLTVAPLRIAQCDGLPCTIIAEIA